jgi:hypothetical protein
MVQQSTIVYRPGNSRYIRLTIFGRLLPVLTGMGRFQPVATGSNRQVSAVLISPDSECS